MLLFYVASEYHIYTQTCVILKVKKKVRMYLSLVFTHNLLSWTELLHKDITFKIITLKKKKKEKAFLNHDAALVVSTQPEYFYFMRFKTQVTRINPHNGPWKGPGTLSLNHCEIYITTTAAFTVSVLPFHPTHMSARTFLTTGRKIVAIGRNFRYVN